MLKRFLAAIGIVALAICVGGRSGRAQEAPPAGAELPIQQLQALIAKPHPGSNAEMEMDGLIGKLVNSPSAAAKRAVYDTIFYWFAVDDTMTAHPHLFAIKEKLERQTNEQALKGAGRLKDFQARSIVFLKNRQELADKPDAQPKYTVLVQLETTTRIDGPNEQNRVRERIAAQLKIASDRVGLSVIVAKNSRIVNTLDQRFEEQSVGFLIWHAFRFFAKNHDANDDQFLRWLVENRRLKRRVASEIVPELFPPVASPSNDSRQSDAEALVAKLFSHFGLPKLMELSSADPVPFQKLLTTGVFSDEDAARIATDRFQSFAVRKDFTYSRRYEFDLSYLIDDDEQSVRVTLNHHGKVANEQHETDVSTDLPADVKIMWSVRQDGSSSQDAIWAASRVFNTVKLEGMSRQQVVKLIGDSSRRPKGVYNRGFWPVGPGESVYRFDNGNYGWQFNVAFDKEGNCTAVKRKWIH